MTSKQYLRQLRDLDRQISARLEQIEILQSQAEKVTTTLGPSPGGGGSGASDKTGENVARIADLKEEINETISFYLELKVAALAKIERLENGRHKYILFQYYLNQKTWEEIAVDLRCSYRWVLTLHGEALIAFGNEYHKRETLHKTS